MKFLSMLAVASLALSPAIASANSHACGENKDEDCPPAAGPLAGRALASEIPSGAIIVGGLIIIGGIIIGIISHGGSSNNTNGVNIPNGVVMVQ